MIYGFFNRTAGGQILFFIEGIRQTFNNKLTNFRCSCRLAVKGNLFISIFILRFVANLEKVMIFFSHCQNQCRIAQNMFYLNLLYTHHIIFTGQ